MSPLISIVDDDALAREGICELVDSLGYKGVTFESANHFLQCGQILDTTCLITDLQMPGLNGLELQEVLPRIRQWSGRLLKQAIQRAMLD